LLQIPRSYQCLIFQFLIHNLVRLTISSEHIYVDIHFDFDNHCLQKGKQSCIADLLYNFMSYAHFSSLFHFLSHPLILILFLNQCQRPYQTQVGDLLCKRNGRSRGEWHMRFGTLYLFPLEESSWLPLSLYGETQSKWFFCPLESTFNGQRVFSDVYWLFVHLFISFVVTHYWSLHNLISRMLSFMVLLMKRFKRSNQLVLLLKESGQVHHLRSNLLEHGLENLSQLFRNLDCHSQKDYSVFFWLHQGKWIMLIVYVDDIVITRDDTQEISEFKIASIEVSNKKLGQLQYFLGIEVARSKKWIILSQRKYVMGMLSEAGMLGCKPGNSPIDINFKLLPDRGSF